jgi:hypothetical protein
VIEQQDEGAPPTSFARHALQFYGSAAVSLCTASDELEEGGFTFEVSTRIDQQHSVSLCSRLFPCTATNRAFDNA